MCFYDHIIDINNDCYGTTIIKWHIVIIIYTETLNNATQTPKYPKLCSMCLGDHKMAVYMCFYDPEEFSTKIIEFSNRG